MKNCMISFVALSLILSGCNATSDDSLKVAQTIVKGLVNSDLSVSKYVSWGSLKMLSMDVGAIFNALPDDQRKDFKDSYISGFGKSFRATGSTYESFNNWQSKDSGSGTALVTVSAGPNLLQIELKKDGSSYVLVGMTMTKK